IKRWIIGEVSQNGSIYQHERRETLILSVSVAILLIFHSLAMPDSPRMRDSQSPSPLRELSRSWSRSRSRSGSRPRSSSVPRHRSRSRSRGRSRSRERGHRSYEDADRCIKYLNQSVLEGRYITVERSRRKRPRTPTPGHYLGLKNDRDHGGRDRDRGSHYGRDDYGDRRSARRPPLRGRRDYSPPPRRERSRRDRTGKRKRLGRPRDES
ncbi:hypothetical protein HID58_074329, partial [Brassica napus]